MGRAKGLTRDLTQRSKRFDPFGAVMGRRRGLPIPALLSPNNDVALAEYRGIVDEMHMGYEFPHFLEIIDNLRRYLSGPGEQQGTYLRMLTEDIASGLSSESDARMVLTQHFEALHLPVTEKRLLDMLGTCESELVEQIFDGSSDRRPILTLDDGVEMCRIIMAIEVGKVAAEAIFEDLDVLTQVMPERYSELTNMARRSPIKGKTPDEMFRALGQHRWEQTFASVLQKSTAPNDVEDEIINATEIRLEYLAEELRHEEDKRRQEALEKP